MKTPSWLLRFIPIGAVFFYVDHTVPDRTIKQLQQYPSVVAVTMPAPADPFNGSLWRFSPLENPTVAVTIVRDTDSRLSLREKAAVDAWLAS